METIYKKGHILVLRCGVFLMQDMTAKHLHDELFKSRSNDILKIWHPNEIHGGLKIFVVELCVDGNSYIGRGNSTECYRLIFTDIPVRLTSRVPE